MKRIACTLLTFAPLLLAACGGTDDGTAASVPDDGIRDLRVPAPEPAANYIDFLGTEAIIQPGEEKMLCTHFLYEGEDTAFDLQEMHQGKFGHHAILLGSKEPLPPGTMEECTDVSSMAKFDAFSLPANQLPPGRGTLLTKGKTLVLQSHYLNTGMEPIRVRDVVRLKTVPIATVDTWVSTYAVTTLDLGLPPQQSTERTFDCVVPQDVTLTLVGGHMHEWGTRFETLIGPDESSLKSVYLVDPWTPEFRDNPPITVMFENPMALPKGTLIRTRCNWNNTTPNVIDFPAEMCSTFGYVEGTKEPIVCILGQ